MVLFVLAETGTSSTICRNSTAKVFPYNYNCCGLCYWSCADSCRNLPYDEKVGVICFISLFTWVLHVGLKSLCVILVTKQQLLSMISCCDKWSIEIRSGTSSDLKSSIYVTWMSFMLLSDVYIHSWVKTQQCFSVFGACFEKQHCAFKDNIVAFVISRPFGIVGTFIFVLFFSPFHNNLFFHWHVHLRFFSLIAVVLKSCSLLGSEVKMCLKCT